MHSFYVLLPLKFVNFALFLFNSVYISGIPHLSLVTMTINRVNPIMRKFISQKRKDPKSLSIVPHQRY
jgi:hypothetical protein